MGEDGRGRSLLTALKAGAIPGGAALVLPVGRPVRATLRPVATRPGGLNEDDVARLTEWRNRFVRSFLTEFPATPERTARWLAEIVGPTDTQILFMVDDAEGRTFGYLGLVAIDWASGAFEVDAIVRGADAPRGLMSVALRTLMRWAQGQLGLREARVRVLSDNTALEFYRKLGFHEVRQVPLRRIEEPGMVRWVEDEGAPDGGRSLVHMVWSDRESG